jgi:hypothetical protein
VQAALRGFDAVQQQVQERQGDPNQFTREAAPPRVLGDSLLLPDRSLLEDELHHRDSHFRMLDRELDG